MGSKTKKNVGAIVRKSGTTFRVWAPFATSVNLSGTFNDWGETPMENEGDGYWFCEVKSASPGQEYKYLIKNGDQVYRRNDPRSLNLTTLAGNSVIVNPEFDWEGDAPLSVPIEQQIVYEMHIGTFNRPDPSMSGTFETAAEKLDYLKDLGVTTIELMPICGMMMEREWWGYTPEYIYTVENLYGGRHQLLEFVKAAHARGMSVILDVVYNHFAADSQLNLWKFDGWSENDKGGIYFYNDWRSATPWGDTRPDYGRPEVRQFLLDNVRMWLWDCHIDGLRVDSTIFIRTAQGINDYPDNDIPDGWFFLEQVNRLAKKISPKSFIVAEDIAVNHHLVKPLKEGGAGFDAQWEVNFPQAIRQTLSSNDPEKISLSPLIDQLLRSFNGNPLQRVIFIDSHDSAANGSARFVEVIAPKRTSEMFAKQQALLAATILMTTPGIPMILHGQEFMQGGSFNDWQGLDWDNTDKFSGIVTAYKHLIALRKNVYGLTAGLTGGNIDLFHQDETNKVLAYHRWSEGGARDDVVVLLNFGNRSYDEYEIKFPAPGTWRIRFNSNWSGYASDFKNIEVEDVDVDDSLKAKLILPPSCGLILSQD